MNKRVFQVLAVVFVISLLLFAGNTASARPNLSFTATQVYWDSPYRIAVEGYFQNTGSQTVTAITYFNLNIVAPRDCTLLTGLVNAPDLAQNDLKR